MIGDVKGILLGARMKFLQGQGAEAKERVLAKLSQADKAILAGVLLPNTWYAGELLARLETAVADVLVRGSRSQLFLEMGRYSAQTNLSASGTQRAYMRVGDVQFFLSHVPRMYTFAHAAGRRVYEKTGADSAVIHAFEAGHANAEDCLTTVGWLERGIELSGAKGVRVVETQCRAKGAAHCAYRCEWW